MFNWENSHYGEILKQGHYSNPTFYCFELKKNLGVGL